MSKCMICLRPVVLAVAIILKSLDVVVTAGFDSAGVSRAREHLKVHDQSTHETSHGVSVQFRDHDCIHIETPVLDWEKVFNATTAWLDMRAGKEAVVMVEHGGGLIGHLAGETAAIKDAFHQVWGRGDDHFTTAKNQCPLGVLCLCALKSGALASMHTDEASEAFECVEELMAQTQLFALVGTKWPVFRILAWFWTVNKVPIREISDFKNVNRFLRRQYPDILFTTEELAPFGQGNSVQWHQWLGLGGSKPHLTSEHLDALMEKSALSFNVFRPAVSALAVALGLWYDSRAAFKWAARPFVVVSLAYGEEFASLMPLAWARWHTMGYKSVLFVAMDAAAKSMCQQFYLTCVSLPVPSILHKYTIASLALHLGIDVLYCDLDAVPLGEDPIGYASLLPGTLKGGSLQLNGVPHGDSSAPDLVLSTHNYDCLNAGVWFARASNASASFFLTLLEYLYEHWYEGDQRAFNALAIQNVSVSYMNGTLRSVPKLMVAVASPDVFAGTEGVADVAQAQLFHLYKTYGDEKLGLLARLYGFDLAAGALESTSRRGLVEVLGNPKVKELLRTRAKQDLQPYVKPRQTANCW